MAIKLHDLEPAEGAKHRKRRVARGDRGRGGKTAGRGTKGTGARGKVPVWFEGGQTPLIQRIPKLPGFTRHTKRVENTVVNVDRLDAHFEDGDEITSELLDEEGLVRSGRPVKVLGRGGISIALTVAVDAVSASAREKIEAAGGTVITDEDRA